MSLLRDKHPGIKVESLTQLNEGDTKINGGFSIGFQDGQLVDQYEAKVIDQGLASAFFHLDKKVGAKNETSHFNFRLEPDRIHGKTGDYGINLYYKSSALGDISAYTYKKQSLESSISYLAKFANDPNNSQHVLYAYISKLLPILNAISGTTPLGASSSREAAKSAVFGNLAQIAHLVDFPTKPEYDELLNNYLTDPTSFNGLENVIYFKLDLSSIDPTYNEPFLVSIDFNGTATSFINIRIHNLPWQNKFATFDIGIIDAYDDGIFNINKARLNNFTLELNNRNDLNNKGYIDLVDLPILLEVGINTTKAMIYHFTGKFHYSTFDYPLDFFIEITDKVNPNTGLLDVICYIKISYSGIENTFFSELYVEQDTIYYKKYRADEPIFGRNYYYVEYFKVTSDELLNDIVYYLCKYMLQSNFLYDQINGNMGTEPPTKGLDFITSFKNEQNVAPNKSQFTLAISGKVKSVFKLSGTVHIEYHPVTFELLGIYAPLKLAVVGVSIDLDIQHDNKAQNYRDQYYNFLACFKNNVNTKGLKHRMDPANPNDNVYKYDFGKGGIYNAIGEVNFI